MVVPIERGVLTSEGFIHESRPEFEAFLAAALSPLITDADTKLAEMLQMGELKSTQLIPVDFVTVGEEFVKVGGGEWQLTMTHEQAPDYRINFAKEGMISQCILFSLRTMWGEITIEVEFTNFRYHTLISKQAEGVITSAELKELTQIIEDLKQQTIQYLTDTLT